MLRRLKHSWTWLVGSEGWKSVFGWLVLLSGIPLFMGSLVSHQSLGEVNGEGLVFIWVYAGGCLALFYFLSHRYAREGKRQLWTVVVLMAVGLSGTCYLLTAAALSVSELSRNPGWPVSYQPTQQSLDLSDLNLKILYEALGVVPFLNIPQTLGWKDPIPKPGPVLGWACVIVKAVLLIVVLSGVTKLIRSMQAAGAEARAGGTTHSEDDDDQR